MRLCFSMGRCAHVLQDRCGALSIGITFFLAGMTAVCVQADDRLVVRGPLRAGEARIVAALEAKTEFEFLETPLQEVIDFLRDFHGIEIQMDQRALEDVGIGTDTPVTRNLKGITLRSALRLVLRDLELTWVVRDEVLLITTEEAADEWLEVRVYNVADLAAVGLDTDELADVLQESLRVKGDDDAQGKTSLSIRPLKTLLIVRNNEAGHRNIADLLAVLRGELKAAGPADRGDSKAAPAIAPTARRKTQPATRRPVKDADPFRDPARNPFDADEPAAEGKNPFGDAIENDNPFRDAPPIEKPARGR